MRQMRRVSVTADIPSELIAADVALHKYGRWAMDRRRVLRCGSAEGRYRAPQNDDDRTPREMLFGPDEAVRVQRALARVPERERVVLAILYVPRPPWSIEAQLRIARVPPSACRERHLHGLRMFANIYSVTRKS